MVEPSRIEHVRTELTPGDALCAAIEAHKSNIFVRTSPLAPILPLLVAHVRATDRRLAALEAAQSTEQQREAEFIGKALHVVDVARAEGMIEPPLVREGPGPDPSDPFCGVPVL